MNLEGKMFGYNKKVLVGVIYTLIIIGGAFFVGAKYEKNKLSRMGLLKNKTTVSKTKKEKEKPKPVVDENAAVNPDEKAPADASSDGAKNPDSASSSSDSVQQ